MKLEFSKKCDKGLRKMPVYIQQKYSHLVKDLKKVDCIYNLQKYDFKRMRYDDSVLRLKIDYHYRVIIKEINPYTFQIVGIFNREDINYIGS